MSSLSVEDCSQSLCDMLPFYARLLTIDRPHCTNAKIQAFHNLLLKSFFLIVFERLIKTTVKTVIL